MAGKTSADNGEALKGYQKIPCSLLSYEHYRPHLLW